MKHVALALFAVVAVLFAVMIFGFERETQALMVGMIMGILAGVPVSLLLIWGLGRRSEPRGPDDRQQHRRDDRIVVINPPASGYPLGGYRETPALAPPTSPRQYTILGEDADPSQQENESWREQ